MSDWTPDGQLERHTSGRSCVCNPSQDQDNNWVHNPRVPPEPPPNPPPGGTVPDAARLPRTPPGPRAPGAQSRPSPTPPQNG